MSLESALYTKVTTTSAITALISTRFYPVKIPQNSSLPAAVYENSSGFEYQAFSQGSGTEERSMQITVYADTYSEVKSIESEFKTALSRWVSSSDNIQDTLITNQNDIYSDELELFGSALDLTFFLSV